MWHKVCESKRPQAWFENSWRNGAGFTQNQILPTKSLSLVLSTGVRLQDYAKEVPLQRSCGDWFPAHIFFDSFSVGFRVSKPLVHKTLGPPNFSEKTLGPPTKTLGPHFRWFFTSKTSQKMFAASRRFLPKILFTNFAASRRFYSLKPYLGRCKREKYLIYKTHYFWYTLFGGPSHNVTTLKRFQKPMKTPGPWKMFSKTTWYKGFLDGTMLF